MVHSENMGSEFEDWLKNEIKVRGWNQAELARRSGLSEAAISRILTRRMVPRIKRRPNTDTCQAIAKALEMPVSQVYIAAGYQPDGEVITRRRALIEFMAEQMDEKEYSDLLDYIQFRVSKSKKGR